MRRLGAAPADRTGGLRSLTGSSCPDVFEADDTVVVIGTLLPVLPDGAPGDASVGPGKAAVSLPRPVMLDAAAALLATDPDQLLANSEAQGQQQRDRAELQFLHALLILSAKADLGEELMLRSDGQQIHAAVNVSDVFWWGGADAEDVTPERLPMLEQAYADLRAIDRREDMYLAELFAARVRGMRPQGAAYPKERAATQALFDACGPEREVGLLNPRKPPVPQDAGKCSGGGEQTGQNNLGRLDNDQHQEQQ